MTWNPRRICCWPTFTVVTTLTALFTLHGSRTSLEALTLEDLFRELLTLVLVEILLFGAVVLAGSTGGARAAIGVAFVATPLRQLVLTLSPELISATLIVLALLAARRGYFLMASLVGISSLALPMVALGTGPVDFHSLDRLMKVFLESAPTWFLWPVATLYLSLRSRTATPQGRNWLCAFMILMVLDLLRFSTSASAPTLLAVPTTVILGHAMIGAGIGGIGWKLFDGSCCGPNGTCTR